MKLRLQYPWDITWKSYKCTITGLRPFQSSSLFAIRFILFNVEQNCHGKIHIRFQYAVRYGILFSNFLTQPAKRDWKFSSRNFCSNRSVFAFCQTNSKFAKLNCRIKKYIWLLKLSTVYVHIYFDFKSLLSSSCGSIFKKVNYIVRPTETISIQKKVHSI